MNFQIVHPTGFLKNYIRQYCFMETDIHEGDMMERVIPTENVQLMFHYKNPFVVCHENDTVTQQPRTIISGLTNTFSDVSTFGEAGVIFVQFHPAGACHFFPFPLSEIENQSFDLADIFSAEIKQVEEKLFLSQTTNDKISVIEDFLMRKYSPIPQHDNFLICKGIQIIKQHRGQIAASQLSEKLATSPKSLVRKFASNLGKTPKQYIKLIRFQETLRDFSAGEPINLTEYAYRNGYFDQSHFIHDFKTYSGFTPKEFVTRYPDFNINADNC